MPDERQAGLGRYLAEAFLFRGGEQDPQQASYQSDKRQRIETIAIDTRTSSGLNLSCSGF